MALKQLIATTEIDMVVEPGRNADREKGIAARPPKTRRIATGTHFKAKDEAQQKELVERLKCAVFVEEEDTVAKASAKDEDPLESLREEYAEVVGKKAPKNMTAETMRAKIEEAEKAAADAKAKADADGEDMV